MPDESFAVIENTITVKFGVLLIYSHCEYYNSMISAWRMSVYLLIVVMMRVFANCGIVICHCYLQWRIYGIWIND